MSDVYPVLLSEDVIKMLARDAGKSVTVEWGEPDADGFYSPTVTEYLEDDPHYQYEPTVTMA